MKLHYKLKLEYNNPETIKRCLRMTSYDHLMQKGSCEALIIAPEWYFNYLLIQWLIPGSSHVLRCLSFFADALLSTHELFGVSRK